MRSLGYVADVQVAIGLALVLALFYRVLGGYPRLPQPLRRLSRREEAFVAAAADALFPPGGAVPPSGLDAGIPAWTSIAISTRCRPARAS